ncbi:MAG: Rab family GTPase [Promethearchaeota archaeon]
MYDYALKIIVIGPGAVGKSSLIRRFVENDFSFNYKFTIGVEISSKLVEFKKGLSAMLTIWDIGGQDRFKILRRNFYDGTNGAFIVFDLSRAETFEKMKEWVADMNHLLDKEIPFIILGNKSDLIPKIGEILDQTGPKYFASENNSVYIQTSARLGDNVEKAFKELTKKIIKINSEE